MTLVPVPMPLALRRLAPLGMALPLFLHAQSAPADSVRRARASAIASHLRAERFDSATALFADKLRADIPASRLSEIWKGLVASLGTPAGLDTARNAGAEVVVPIRFRAITIDAGLAFDAEGRAMSLALRPGARTPQSPPPAPAAPLPPSLPTPNDAFARGDFAAAARQAEARLAQRPDDAGARLRLAGVALLRNRPHDTRRLLASLDPATMDSAQRREHYTLLAEASSRLHDFPDAAQASTALGRTASAARYSAFGALKPYAHDAASLPLRLPFVRTDPLPVVALRVNGAAPRYFIIDTGAGDTILDTAFATAVGARRVGADSAAFAGGNRTRVEHGVIDSLQLGSLVVHRVPIRIQPTRMFSMASGGLPVDGVIGTGLFREFRSTLDYPAGELRLESSATPRKAAPDERVAPMWLAGDHFMVAWGRVGGADSTLMLLDTGLVGATFVAPDTVFRLAGLGVDAGEAVSGVGGAGTVHARLVTIPTLSFAGMEQHQVPAMMGVFPPVLEHQFGFPIRGLVSHQFLRSTAVTFDFARMEVVLRGAPAPPRTSVTR